MRRRRDSFWRSFTCLAGVGLLIAGVAARAGEGQQRSSGSATQQAAPSSALPSARVQPGAADSPFRAGAEDKRIASASTERHRRMLEDADKLVQLAAALRDDVDKTTKDEMSVPTIKKAAEIEKLAHDVKERMKGQ
jgi:hypothetical protein